MASEIGVQTIQHTNGTDAMTIDSSGRVQTPARPSWIAYQSGGWQDLAANSQTLITWDSVVSGYNSSGYSTSTGKYTAPVAGLYWIETQFYMNSDDNFAECTLFKNTTDTANRLSRWGVTLKGDSHCGTSTIVQLSANETVFATIYKNTANSSNEDWYAGGEPSYSRFQGYLIG